MTRALFTARNSRWRLALLGAGAASFVFGGLVIAGLFGPPLRPGAEWFGWFCIAFFGLGGLVIVQRLFDRSEVVRIDGRGIYFKPWSEQTIPWSEIRDVTVWQLQGQRLIILHLANPDGFPSKKLLGWVAGANRVLTGGDIPIGLVGTDGNFDDAMATITRHRRRLKQADAESRLLTLESAG